MLICDLVLLGQSSVQMGALVKGKLTVWQDLEQAD
jgi:hypothetical protein